MVGYISNFQTKYSKQMICTTVSALGSAAIGTNIVGISFARILFLLLGTAITICANKVILPYKMSDVTKKEVKKSVELKGNI